MSVSVKNMVSRLGENQTAGVGKEKNMEDMNSFELETFLKMILEILNGCNDLKEAQEKIKALLER